MGSAAVRRGQPRALRRAARAIARYRSSDDGAGGMDGIGAFGSAKPRSNWLTAAGFVDPQVVPFEAPGANGVVTARKP
jgi:hypothetical protein